MTAPTRDHAQTAPDVFRAEMRTATTALTEWAAALADVADFEVEEGPDFWRMAARPRAANAAGFEFVIHGDQQLDISIGGVVSPRVQGERLAVLVEIAERVAAGDLIARRGYSLQTGEFVGVDVLVGRPLVWRARGESAPGPANRSDVEMRDRHFVAWRR